MSDFPSSLNVKVSSDFVLRLRIAIMSTLLSFLLVLYPSRLTLSSRTPRGYPKRFTYKIAG
jgi:hypothetical protein